MLLTHSMGNHTSSFGLERRFATPRRPTSRADAKFFPVQHYVLVDCTSNEDVTQPSSVKDDTKRVARVLNGLAVTAGGRRYDAPRATSPPCLLEARGVH